MEVIHPVAHGMDISKKDAQGVLRRAVGRYDVTRRDCDDLGATNRRSWLCVAPCC